MVKLSEAQSRLLRYMADTGCKIASVGWSTGYTVDIYRWPISGWTMGAMQRDGLIARDPSSNEHDAYVITPAGKAALKEEGR